MGGKEGITLCGDVLICMMFLQSCYKLFCSIDNLMLFSYNKDQISTWQFNFQALKIEQCAYMEKTGWG